MYMPQTNKFSIYKKASDINTYVLSAKVITVKFHIFK